MGLFAEKGYEKTTMRQISKEAKLGLGALYYYFPSKESIVATFYEQLQVELTQEWAEQDPGAEADLSQRLAAFLRFKLEKLEPYRPLMRILLKEAVDPDSALSPLSSDSKPALDKSLKTFQSMLEPEDGDDGESVARLLWLGHMAVIALWIHRPSKVDKIVDRFADVAPFLALALSNQDESLIELLFD